MRNASSPGRITAEYLPLSVLWLAVFVIVVERMLHALSHEALHRIPALYLHGGVIATAGVAALLLTRYVVARRRVREALRHDNDCCRSLVEGLSLLVCRFTPDGTLTFVNEAYCRYFGRRREDIVGHTFYELIPSAEREMVRHLFADVTPADPVRVSEYRVLTPGGEVRWQRWRDRALFDGDGAVIEFHSVGEDITDIRKGEERLRASERRFREVLENIRLIGIMVGFDEKIIFCNRHFCEMIGCRPEEVVGKSWVDLFIPPELRRDIRERFSARESHRDFPYHHENDILTRGGGRRAVRWNNTPLFDDQGNICGLTSIGEDITGQRLMEGRLCRSERRFREVLENVHMLAVMVDQNGTVTFCNEWFCRVTGFAPERARGSNWFDLVFPPEEREASRRRFPPEAPDESVLEHYVSDILTATGERRRIRWNRTPLFDDAGTLSGFTCLGEDVTERERVERELREREAHLEMVVSNLPVNLFQQDRDLRYVWAKISPWQPGAERWAEIVGKNDHEVFVPDEAEILASVKRRVIETGTGIRREFRLQTPDGRPRYVDAIFNPWPGPDGRVSGIIGCSREVTEYRLAEQAAREDEQKLRDLVEQSPNGIMLVDEKGLVVEWNRSEEEVTGIPHDEAVGRAIWDVWEEIRPESVEPQGRYPGRFRAFISSVLRTGDSPELNRVLELEITPRGGGRKTVQLVVFPIRHGDTIMIGSINRDISGLRQAEEALHISEERYRALIDNISLGIALVSPAMEVVSVNRTLREWFPDCDLTPGRLCHRTFPVSDTGSICSFCPAVETLRDGSPHERFTEVRGRHYRVQSSPLRDRTGEISSVIEIVEDVTERTKAERELLAYQERLRSVSSELSLVEERERREIAAYLHDTVAQSLAIARIRLGELEKKFFLPTGETGRVGEIREYIEESIRSTRDLMDELSPPVLYELGLCPAVEWLAEQVQRRHGVDCAVRGYHDGRTISEQSRVILFKAVRELLMNVVKHARAERVAVTVARVSDTVAVEVEDDGVGFAAGALDAYRTRRGGFGLFNLREQIEYLGGRLEIRSVPGRGTSVRIEVPSSGGQTKEKRST